MYLISGYLLITYPANSLVYHLVGAPYMAERLLKMNHKGVAADLSPIVKATGEPSTYSTPPSRQRGAKSLKTLLITSFRPPLFFPQTIDCQDICRTLYASDFYLIIIPDRLKAPPALILIHKPVNIILLRGAFPGQACQLFSLIYIVEILCLGAKANLPGYCSSIQLTSSGERD